ncbi:Putative mycothiol-dependent maleylpyruvate isomerase [Kitasatospora sp. MMS16-BH015]|uniref:maleylpyruvate isomerase family mycothiol-dependent enzyme n=1 Tax=Kitasatospora sp. MMS16-BH015 TaxID=2018025 RepID=UPI000CA3CC1F|nr:maleylpyruvate isomerase family mycothiol-dependent enzyme [Kitasatospora sp. MMS16-BH015]AUG80128.1 Putative mycothiol-dependent maleylpyruvate isomerase [Kitasatospora sp. MMS16-BH015]
MTHQVDVTTALNELAEAFARLHRTVAELPPEAVAEPSALPGWTRGHVLSHVSRNADSLVNLLEGARTGRDIPQYVSQEVRDQDIADGAPRPLAEQLDDLTASDTRLVEFAAALPAEAWLVEVRHRSGAVLPAYDLLPKRLGELEYHHVDLDAGYTPAHWPEGFATYEFTRLLKRYAAEPGLPAVELAAEDDFELTGRLGAARGEPELRIEGPVRALVAWLSGRSDGDGLQVHRGGEQLTDPRSALPELPAMS